VDLAQQDKVGQQYALEVDYVAACPEIEGFSRGDSAILSKDHAKKKHCDTL